MSPELIAIVAVGVSLGAVMLAAMRGLRSDLRSEMSDLRSDLRSEMSDLRSEVRDVRSDVGDLRERMARLEGLFEGFTGRGGQEVTAS